MIKRRYLLKLLSAGSSAIAYGLLFPVKVLARWNEAAYAAENINEALSAYYPNKQLITSNKINITVRPEIENGAVVPIKVNTDLKNVESIAIFVEKNPNPLIANFNLSPACKGFISTRIKMDGPSDILVVVVSDGQPYSTSKSVIVHAGGCG